MPVGQAAPTATHAAVDKKGLADDITVIIVDFLASEGERLPAPLAQAASAKSSKGAATLDHLHTWHPLEAPSMAWRYVSSTQVCEVHRCAVHTCAIHRSVQYTDSAMATDQHAVA
jgi:hypothetical protein